MAVFTSIHYFLSLLGLPIPFGNYLSYRKIINMN